MPKPVKRLISAARHEAAHAVVAEHLGYRVRRVVLLKTRAGRGFSDREYKRASCPFEVALICLAGPAADHKWNRVSSKKLSSGDACNVLSIGFKWRAVNTLLLHSRALVDELAAPILAVAKELKVRNLTGRDVRRIIRRT